jgi:hypothetical protein
VAELLANTPEAEATLQWLGRRTAPLLLAELATGQLELSHAALDARAHPRATDQVRGVLLTAGGLPAIDPVLLDCQRWLDRRLHLLAEHPHHRLLLQFGRWRQLPRMCSKASTHPLAYGALVYAQQQFTAARLSLTWLADNGHRPRSLTHADLDTWFVTASGVPRQKVRGLLTWAMNNRHLPALDVPVPAVQPGPGITQQQRLDLLRRSTNDHGIELGEPQHRNHLAVPRPTPRPADPLHPTRPPPQRPRHARRTDPHHGAAPARQGHPPGGATALGFHSTTTHRQAVNAGAIWSRYAAGDRHGGLLFDRDHLRAAPSVTPRGGASPTTRFDADEY